MNKILLFPVLFFPSIQHDHNYMDMRDERAEIISYLYFLTLLLFFPRQTS